MQKRIIWRCLLIIPTALLASVIIFGVMRILPNDIVRSITGDVPVSVEAREALETELGLNKDLHVQYLEWLKSILLGEFGGRSLETGKPIGLMIARQLPVTVLLAFYAMVLSLLLSFPAGILAAVWKGSWFDKIVMIYSAVGIATPHLVLAVAILLGLVVFLQWSPPIIYSMPWVDPWNHIQMVFWPAMIISWERSSNIVRVIRFSLLESLGQPYINTARGKGMSNVYIVLWHAIPNALMPIITIVAIEFGALLSGILIVETIFGLPGIGRGLVQAALSRDYPVVQTLSLILVSLSLIVNLVSDVAHNIVDPRVSAL